MRLFPFGCAASEADFVRGSPCGEPARLRFTSLRPPPAAAPPKGKGVRRVTVRTIFQMVIVGLATLVVGLPAIALGMLVPGQSRKGKIFRWVTKSWSRTG